MQQCPNCETILQSTRLHCNACSLAFEGTFQTARLARLEPEQQQLVEEIVLAGGNLKAVASALDVSYPTLRKRLDNLMSALQALREADEAQTTELLDAVEAGDMPAETATRLIRELHGQS